MPPEFNEAYREFFRVDPPSRSTVGVAALARPELIVEIEAIAVVPVCRGACLCFHYSWRHL